MTICLSDRTITIETILWLIICSVPVTVFKLPVVLKESLYKSRFFHRQTLNNRIAYNFSSNFMNTLGNISLQTQDRIIGLILMILYLSKLHLEGWLNGSNHLLAEVQHFSIIIMILLLLISSNIGYMVGNPNAVDVILHLLTTTMPYWAVNSTITMYSTLIVKDNVSLFINILLIIMTLLLPLYLLCRKNFLVIQLINNNISINASTKASGGGKLLIFGVWLFVQIRWTVQQFIAILSKVNIEAMLCADNMKIITNHLPEIPSYRTHLSILILSFGFFATKLYNQIATDLHKFYDKQKIFIKSSTKKT